VTITGTGLADVTAVDFGSTPAASFSVVSATQIDAVAPANAVGTVDVTVAVAGGTSSLSPNDKFIYDTVPGPQNPVTAVAGNGEAFVSPASDGDGLVPITSYTVTASPGDEQASGATTPITVPGLTNGTSYTFTVTATNALGTGPPSNPSNAVTPFGPPTSLTQPALSTSTPEIDDTIATTTGSWTFSPTSYRYQWLACAAGGGCTPIPGATGGSYTIRPADTGMELAVDVTATNSMGQSAPAESERTTVVVARPGVPVNLTPPAISGDPAAGSTLTASDGTWSKAPTTVTIQFLDCSQPGLGCHDDGQPFEESISDPASLALSNTDAADYTEALVFATNAVGDSAAVTTNTLGPVIAAPAELRRRRLLQLRSPDLRWRDRPATVGHRLAFVLFRDGGKRSTDRHVDTRTAFLHCHGRRQGRRYCDKGHLLLRDRCYGATGRHRDTPGHDGGAAKTTRH
jgi:hypothetical protein